MRTNLIRARKDKGWTQEQTAEKIGINIRYYKAIEYGEKLGAIWIWDDLEDIFGVNQRVLRENHPDTKDSQAKHPIYPPSEQVN